MPTTSLNKAILQSVDEGIYGLDRNGFTTFANAASTRLTGWRIDELIGRKQHLIIHHTKADGTLNPAETCPIYGVCQSGEPYKCDDDLFWRKDGSSFPVSYTATPLWTDGVLVGSVVVFRDISDKKANEKYEHDRKADLERLVGERTRDLRRTHAQLAAVLNAAVVSIIVVDIHGTITIFNPGAEALLGYRASEIIGRHTPVIFHSKSEMENRGRELSAFYGREISGMEVFTATSMNGGSEEREWTYIHKDGHSIPVVLFHSAIHDDNDMVTGFLGIAYDISIRKLAEERLAQAKEAAENANRAKSEFLATMSHEIRTPMNGVLGMAQLLRDSGLNTLQRQRTDILCESAEALLVVLNDILDFSKLEAHKLQLEIVDFDLRKVLESVADLMGLKAQGKGVELTCFIDQNVPTLIGSDPTRLRQVLSNLLGNAVKFTAVGNVAVRVSLENAVAGSALRFEVSDTGVGVPADKQHLLFERFSQADATTSRKFGGTGLGLSIVRGIVEMMGGQIGFTSVEGHGSTFWFTAPLLQYETREGSARTEFIGKRVLVVDDSAPGRAVTADLLRSWHCVVEEAADGPSALFRLQDRQRPQFDVVVIDLEMPGMRGDALADAIRANAALAQQALVMLVPLRHRSSADMRWVGDWSAYVSKPVKQADLMAAIGGLLKFDTSVDIARSQSDATLANRRCRHRVLAVDDNRANQSVISAMLDKLGFVADVVGSGAEAMDRLSEIEYSIILTDCEMPVMDGYELSRLIRQAPSPRFGRNIPIIAVTAHASLGHRDKCLAAGMNDMVTKPIQLSVLGHVLDRWLDDANAETPLPEQSIAEVEVNSSPQKVAMTHFSPEELIDRMMGDQDLARSLVRSFLDHTPQHLAALAGAIANADLMLIANNAHSIKGTAGNVGATGVYSAAASLEVSARAGDAASSRLLMHDLVKAFLLAKEAMQAFSSGLS